MNNFAFMLRGKKRVNRSFMGSFWLFLLLALMGAFMALPLVYAINAAFKPLDEIFLFPPTLFVRNPTMTNFVDLVNLLGNSWVPFSRYLFNTVFITGMGIENQRHNRSAQLSGQFCFCLDH